MLFDQYSRGAEREGGGGWSVWLEKVEVVVVVVLFDQWSNAVAF
jgi:hypothetical protein